MKFASASQINRLEKLSLGRFLAVAPTTRERAPTASRGFTFFTRKQAEGLKHWQVTKRGICEAQREGGPGASVMPGKVIRETEKERASEAQMHS